MVRLDDGRRRRARRDHLVEHALDVVRAEPLELHVDARRDPRAGEALVPIERLRCHARAHVREPPLEQVPVEQLGRSRDRPLIDLALERRERAFSIPSRAAHRALGADPAAGVVEPAGRLDRPGARGALDDRAPHWPPSPRRRTSAAAFSRSWAIRWASGSPSPYTRRIALSGTIMPDGIWISCPAVSTASR